MNILTALLIFATVPMDRHLMRETVDCVERNEFYDDEGKRVFCQWILWDWDGARHSVVAWRMNSGQHFQQRTTQLTWSEGGNLRQVRGAYWRETWTQFDPEVAEREILHRGFRRGLFGAKE